MLLHAMGTEPARRGSMRGMTWRSGRWVGLCFAVGAAASACSADDGSDDTLADPTIRPPEDDDRDDEGRSRGGLPVPSASSSGGKPPQKDGGGGADQDGGASSGSSSGAAECADPNDIADSVGDIAYPAEYTKVASADQATKEVSGVMRDYFDYDYFGFDVYRNASATVFPYQGGEAPFPADTELCMFVQCLSGNPTSFSCDAGEETTDFSGHPGCCSVSSAVSLYYATCDGDTGDDAFAFVRVTPNDQEICSAPYTVRAAFNH